MLSSILNLGVWLTSVVLRTIVRLWLHRVLLSRNLRIALVGLRIVSASLLFSNHSWLLLITLHGGVIILRDLNIAQLFVSLN